MQACVWRTLERHASEQRARYVPRVRCHPPLSPVAAGHNAGECFGTIGGLQPLATQIELPEKVIYLPDSFIFLSPIVHPKLSSGVARERFAPSTPLCSNPCPGGYPDGTRQLPVSTWSTWSAVCVIRYAGVKTPHVKRMEGDRVARPPRSGWPFNWQLGALGTYAVTSR
eukprot:2929028-Prymnesium_polylepis.1